MHISQCFELLGKADLTRIDGSFGPSAFVAPANHKAAVGSAESGEVAFRRRQVSHSCLVKGVERVGGVE